MNKHACLSSAIEITKEYARSGAGNGSYDLPAEVLEKVYNKLVEISKTLDQ